MKKIVLAILIVIAYAYSAPGDLLWKFQTTNFVEGTMFESKGIIYTGLERLYALDALTGELIWEKDSCCGPEIRYSNGLFYLGALFNKGKIACIKESNGDVVWAGGSYSNIDGQGNWLDDGRLFSIQFEDGYGHCAILAINAENGEMIWRLSREDEKDYRAPTAAEGKVFVGNEDTYFYALNAINSSEIWKFKTEGTFYSASLFHNQVVYVPGADEYFYALNANNGALLWKYHSVDNYDEFHTPIYNEGVIYVSNTNNVTALEAETGELKWVNGGVHTIYQAPAILDGMVYVCSTDRYLYALDAKTGLTQWSYRTGNQMRCTPCFWHGIIYFGSFDDYVYAIKSDSGFSSSNSSSYLPSPFLSAYPNPFKDRLTIEVTDKAKIYSLTGQLIMKLDKGKHSLDTSKWREGVYIVKSGMECRRVVKIR